MKRSIAVSLVIMGAAATLTACEDTTINSSVYTSVDECEISYDYSRERCEQDFAEAQKAHAKFAPAFKSQTDCEAEFGQGKCEPAKAENAAAASSGGSHSSFVPLMMGYMMGSRMGTTDRSMAPQALYRPSNTSNFVNSNGASVASKVGRMTMSGRSEAARAPVGHTKSLARGGFGSRSMSFAG
ncbi:DUF1190 domain-containing protein [Mesorhizobium sp. SP-1A]|uniref:DUF1190 domain-containing protein n=1 Tax=Mesorhizobium sp. SP-1A TaxID=3077840 RepID=UPI0028F6E68E|nr:DUF1190 domain-containing protein [Mesorhizobium sp. SP-1A]